MARIVDEASNELVSLITGMVGDFSTHLLEETKKVGASGQLEYLANLTLAAAVLVPACCLLGLCMV
jgi:hypothetical protein